MAAPTRCWPYPANRDRPIKTAFSKMLRGLIDPNAAPVRTGPREERDLFIAASNGHVLAFDNLSELPPWMSDALCRIASGGSFAVRQLYTDRDEVLFQAARPIILNGIEDVVTRPDLADRAIFLNLPHLQEELRRTEKEIWHDFEAARPHMLGALLHAASHGLRALPEVRLGKLPRMADFALWATACEPGFCPAGGFLHAYKANRRSAVEDVVEADPVAARIRDIMAERTVWSGSASELFRVTAPRSREDASSTGLGWPRSPKRWPVGSDACRRPSEPWVSRSPLVERGERARASSGWQRHVQLHSPRPSAPSALHAPSAKCGSTLTSTRWATCDESQSKTLSASASPFR